MSFDYINEAFKRLDMLNESMFDTSLNGINELSDFLDNQDDVIQVIDPEATQEEDLQDSYVGKVIINCNVCHSHIFKNKEDIVIDENNDVNAEDFCPYCNEQEGFVIIGEITPYAQPTEEPVETEETVVDSADDSSDELEEGTVLDGVMNMAANVIGRLVDSCEPEDATKTITEDFKEVTITTDDQHMEMTSDDNGKITVTTEPVTEEAVEPEETIAPVSDETVSEIVDNNTEEPADAFDFETESNIDFSEIDEDSLDELGEAYFRNVYENVTGFKTTSVGANDTGILIEGVIDFASGAQKKTGFVFEAQDYNSRGKVRFVGHNKQICESATAFALVGSVNENKLIAESLKYNYSVGDTSVRGVVRRK